MIGKAGAMIKRLRSVTETIIEIPGRNAPEGRPVLVRGSSLGAVLHACWEINNLIFVRRRGRLTFGTNMINENGNIVDDVRKGNPDETISYSLEMKSASNTSASSTTAAYTGAMKRGKQRNEPFMTCDEGSGLLSVYCLEAPFICDIDAERDKIGVLIDNERFVDSNMASNCVIVEVPRRHDDIQTEVGEALLFIHGTPDQKPQQLLERIEKHLLSSWTRHCERAVLASKNSLPYEMSPDDEKIICSRSFTVGTYNLLHPTYAEKYLTVEGVTKSGCFSNWSYRAPAIRQMLQSASLDVYLLQEVDKYQLQHDILEGCFCDGEILSLSLRDAYYCVHSTHPTREAHDGVAILCSKSRFVLEKEDMVAYDAKLDEHHGMKYMCAAIAHVRDKLTGLKIILASVHFYPKKALHPEQTLLRYLEEHKTECDAIIWGGDCNKEYSQANPPRLLPSADDHGKQPSYYACVDGGSPTMSSGRKIDWIFYTQNVFCGSRSNKVTEEFVKNTKSLSTLTIRASDHCAEAVSLTLLK